jgi:hypothetical protein
MIFIAIIVFVLLIFLSYATGYLKGTLDEQELNEIFSKHLGDK